MSNKRNFMSNFRNNRKNANQSPEELVGEFKRKHQNIEHIENDFEEEVFEDVTEETLVGGIKPRVKSEPYSRVIEPVDDYEDEYALGYAEDISDGISIVSYDNNDVNDRVPSFQTAEERARLEEEERERIREEERARIREEERERARQEEKARLAEEKRKEEKRIEEEKRREEKRIEEEKKREQESIFGFESSASISARSIKPVLSGNKREIKVGVIDIKPIKIPKIHDTEGLISERIRQIEDKTGLSVLPFSVTGTLPQVESLSDHDIIEIGGEKYSSGTTRVVAEKRLTAYVDKIKSCIARGQAFEDSLLERQEVDGQIFDTMKFNIRELETLNSLFINIVMAIYEDETGDIRINVGGYYV